MISLQRRISEKLANVADAWRIHLVGPLEDVAPAISGRFSGRRPRILHHKTARDYLKSERLVGVLLVDVGEVFSGEINPEEFSQEVFNREIMYVADERSASLTLNLLRQRQAGCFVRPIDSAVLHTALLDSVKRACLESVRDEVHLWQRANWSALTPREQFICKHLVMGYGNTQIAEILDVRADTIKKHRASILEKVQARTLSDLIRAFKCFDFSKGSAIKCVFANWGDVCPAWHEFHPAKRELNA